MAKVEFPEGPSPYFQGLGGAGTKAAKGKGGPRHAKTQSVFEKAVDKAAVEEAGETREKEEGTGEEAAIALMDKVYIAGEAIKANPDSKAIASYREAVARFIRFIVDAGISVEEKSSGTNIMKRHKFTLLKIVDQKLDQLAANVLMGQKQQMEILRRVDEINGLLVDLMR